MKAKYHSKHKENKIVNRRKWTTEEEDQLSEMWGNVSIQTICKNLGRSRNAVIVRVYRLGLPRFLDSGDYVTFNQLIYAVTGSKKTYSYKIKSWVENRGLPVHTKKINKCSFRIVYLHEFWKWASKYRSFLDFSKMEPLALGKEPAWVAEQRQRDFYSNANQRKDPWTSAEDAELLRLLRLFKYSWTEIADKLHRSVGAIQRRCSTQGIKERPIKATNHNPWSSADFQMLADGIRKGLSYSDIGKQVSRSEKAVRGRVYETYRTENADKVRAMIGAGAWGSGKPDIALRKDNVL